MTPFNTVSDPSGDAKYQVLGTSNELNMPQLDITASSVSQVTTAPCSVAAPCYKIFMQLNNLSLAPTLAQDPNTDLVWSTQWFVPSTSDTHGGADFHVYAESNNGAALQCFTAQNAVSITVAGVAHVLPRWSNSVAGGELPIDSRPQWHDHNLRSAFDGERAGGDGQSVARSHCQYHDTYTTGQLRS